MDKIVQGHKGFTLIEVLVSIMIIGIIGVSIMGLFTTSFKNNKASKERMEGAVAAKDIMEKTKNAIYSTDIKSVEQLQSIVDMIGKQCHEGTITIEEKGERDLFIITIEVPIGDSGKKESFLSQIYVPLEKGSK